jgi:predicted transcriptional regulator
MLIHPSAVDTKAERLREGLEDPQQYDQPELRLTRCEFSFTVGEAFLVFNLPTQSGDATGGPTKATVVSETDAAVRWGRELFEAKWADSEPIERYAVREHPDVWGGTDGRNGR